MEQRLTDSARHILKQIRSRAYDRGVFTRIPDEAFIGMLTLWSVLLWERKIGLVALEEAGGKRFELVGALDRLLTERASELPLAHEFKGTVDGGNQTPVVLGTSSRPPIGWDNEEHLEPLLRQAELEALELGHNYLGSEHLVLAVVKLADPGLSILLHEHGIEYVLVRDAVVRLLQPGG